MSDDDASEHRAEETPADRLRTENEPTMESQEILNRAPPEDGDVNEDGVEAERLLSDDE